jgi:hypothetical protein
MAALQKLFFMDIYSPAELHAVPIPDWYQFYKREAVPTRDQPWPVQGRDILLETVESRFEVTISDHKGAVISTEKFAMTEGQIYSALDTRNHRFFDFDVPVRVNAAGPLRRASTTLLGPASGWAH